jgi:hypothetical protein
MDIHIHAALPIFQFSLFLNVFYLHDTEIFRWEPKGCGGGGEGEEELGPHTVNTLLCKEG